MTFNVKGVKVKSDLPKFNRSEAQKYVDFVQGQISTPLTEIEITTAEDGKVDVLYLAKGTPFERLRRITGYLTADLRFWNNAKQAEERDRLKHGVDDYDEY